MMRLPARADVTAPGAAAKPPPPSQPPKQSIAWRELRQGLDEAKRTHKPLVVFFTAAWAMPCVELEKRVLVEPTVRGELDRYVPVRVDATNEDAAVTAIEERYRVHAVPLLLLLDETGAETQRLVGMIAPDELAATLAANATDGARALHEIERRLLAARKVHVRARMRSGGEMGVDLDVELAIDRTRAALLVAGILAGSYKSGAFRATGKALTPELRDALIVGLVRMGLCHNAAQAAEHNGPPDHATGGVRGWVEPRAARRDGDALVFDPRASGGLTGHTRLELNPRTGLPARRAMDVKLQGTPIARDGAEFTVTETYSLFQVE
jgi:hypothetical protein